MKVSTLADLKTDPKNARKHNPRNIGMIESSLRTVGAARSGVIDENGVILAGNGTYEALAAAGIEKVKVVETDGNEWVVVKRTGLTEEQKRLLALADNRAAELAEWDGPALAEQGIDLKPWFAPYELAKVGLDGETDDPKEHWRDMPTQMPNEAMAHRSINVYFQTPEAVEVFRALIQQTITEKTKWLWFPLKDK